MAIVVGQTEWQLGYALSAQPLGSAAARGGFIICNNGGIVWIVAPCTSEVRRTWHCRNDAITTATECTTATTWFIPTKTQLENPGCVCRIYWDWYSCCNGYHSNTGEGVNVVYGTFFPPDGGDPYDNKDIPRSIRAFRCVTY